jgi:hypothetical protein
VLGWDSEFNGSNAVIIRVEFSDYEEFLDFVDSNDDTTNSISRIYGSLVVNLPRAKKWGAGLSLIGVVEKDFSHDCS